MRYKDHNWVLPPVSSTNNKVNSEYATVALLMDIRDELQALRVLVASTRAASTFTASESDCHQ